MPYSPISQGGRGGRGNTAFKRGLNRAPTMAELGERCEEQWLELEMKLVADVGIVGVPNAGKSTLLAALSNAKCVPPVCFLSPSIRFAARLETTRVRIDWTKSSLRALFGAVAKRTVVCVDSRRAFNAQDTRPTANLSIHDPATKPSKNDVLILPIRMQL